jgi:hypothetical protein
MFDECRYCNVLAPRLYTLPPRIRPELRAVGPACYFCFIRTTGIKPTRRQLAAVTERNAVAGSPPAALSR